MIEIGKDFDDAKAGAERLAAERGLSMVPSFHGDLVKGVASYALELFDAHPDLDAVYVPIGLGSGICGVISARDALGLKAEVIAVVSDKADAAATSIETGAIHATASSHTFADGMATRVPNPDAFAIYAKGAARAVRVTDDEIAEAIRIYHEDTHNMAKGRARPAGRADQGKGPSAGQEVRRHPLRRQHRPRLGGDHPRRRHAGTEVSDNVAVIPALSRDRKV